MNLDGIAPQGNRELRVDSYYKEGARCLDRAKCHAILTTEFFSPAVAQFYVGPL
jgi:hypothetical protein